MKRRLLLLFPACCLALAASAQAASDPFAEFRIPEHSYRVGSIGCDFSANRDHRDFSGQTDRSSSLYSTASGGFRAGWDSDPLQYGFALTTRGQLIAGHSRSRIALGTASEELDEVESTSAEDLRLVGSARCYPWAAPIGLGASAALEGYYAQQLARLDDHASMESPVPARTEYRENQAGHSYQTRATGDLSAGYGRVRDATVVYDVHLLETRLLETGALTRALSAGARAKLAALYYVTPYFSAAHDRPARYVWREIERILREDGALAERGLDPYSVLRAGESPAPGPRPMRQRGWFVGVVGQLSSQRSIYRMENSWAYRGYEDGALVYESHEAGSRRSDNPEDRFALGGEAEYHLPLGWRWQLDANSRVTRPARTGERGLAMANSVSLAWYVADRWLASAALSQSRQYFSPRHVRDALEWDGWWTSAEAGVTYFLEDRTSLSLSVAEDQTRSEYIPYGTRYFSRNGRVQLGLVYRFLGGLDAPGLLEPVRP